MALLFWLGALLVLDRSALARLWKPRFWLVTLLFALLSGLLLGPKDVEVAGFLVSSQGLRAGLLMVLRGALIFAFVSWASRAAGRVKWERILGRVGLGELGRAVSVAVRLLPQLSIRPKGHGLSLFERAVQLVSATVSLAAEIDANEPARRHKVLAIVGPLGSGKTQTALALAREVRENGFVVGGIAQPADNRHAEYRVLNLMTGESRFLGCKCDRQGSSRFLFASEAFAFAAQAIRTARLSADVLVVDEMGWLEAQGQGHMTALLEPLVQERAKVWILAIRMERQAEIAARLGGFDEVFEIGAVAPKEVIMNVKMLVTKWLSLALVVAACLFWACSQSVSGEGQGAQQDLAVGEAPGSDLVAEQKKVTVSYRGEEKHATLYGNTPNQLDDVVKRVYPDIALSAVNADFQASDGFRPAKSPLCKDLIPLDGSLLASGTIDPETRNLSWDEALQFPGCMYVRDVELIEIADK